MAHDGVPWFIGGGAEHSPEVCRMLGYVAFMGAEGVVGELDCRCLAMSTPTNKIRVMPGAYAIKDRGAGQKLQMYAGRVVSQDEVATTATDASGPRSDLVLIRVENPNEAGSPWQVPASVTDGPYVFTRIIEGVPANTASVEDLGLGYSGIAIARIDLPASTSSVTQAMITDLRSIAKPGGQRIQGEIATGGGNASVPVSPSDPSIDSGDAGNTVDWPASSQWNVAIPEWATEMNYSVTLNNMLNDVADFIGGFGIDVGGILSSPLGQLATSFFGVDPLRRDFTFKGTVNLPASVRGTVQTFKLQALVDASNTGKLDVDAFTEVSFDYNFNTRPVS